MARRLQRNTKPRIAAAMATLGAARHLICGGQRQRKTRQTNTGMPPKQADVLLENCDQTM
jgi:hypothetical protein